MPIKDLLKTMFHSFFVITTGVTMAMYISCRLLYPDTVLSVGDIGGILLLALFCDLRQGKSLVKNRWRYASVSISLWRSRLFYFLLQNGTGLISISRWRLLFLYC